MVIKELVLSLIMFSLQYFHNYIFSILLTLIIILKGLIH